MAEAPNDPNQLPWHDPAKAYKPEVDGSEHTLADWILEACQALNLVDEALANKSLDPTMAHIHLKGAKDSFNTVIGILAERDPALKDEILREVETQRDRGLDLDPTGEFSYVVRGDYLRDEQAVQPPDAPSAPTPQRPPTEESSA